MDCRRRGPVKLESGSWCSDDCRGVVDGRAVVTNRGEDLLEEVGVILRDELFWGSVLRGDNAVGLFGAASNNGSDDACLRRMESLFGGNVYDRGAGVGADDECGSGFLSEIGRFEWSGINSVSKDSNNCHVCAASYFPFWYAAYK